MSNVIHYRVLHSNEHFLTARAALKYLQGSELSFDEVSYCMEYGAETCQITTFESNSNFGGIEDVYEFRIFNKDFEVRWLRDDGHLVMLTAKDFRINAFTDQLPRLSDKDQTLQNLCYSDDSKLHPSTISQSYILWGTPGKSDSGSTCLNDPRVGSIDIPLYSPNPANKVRAYAQLYALEYLAWDHFGNARVFAERLMGLKWLFVKEGGAQ